MFFNFVKIVNDLKKNTFDGNEWKLNFFKLN